MFLILILSQNSFSQNKHSKFKKVIIVVFENESVYQADKAPYFSKLTELGAAFTDMNGVERPSQPNYIAMVAGSTYGIKSNKNIDLKVRNITNLLEEAGLDWRAYAEDFPGNCFLKAQSGDYVRKHVPFLSFTNITSHPQKCSKIRDFKNLHADWKAGILPAYTFITPNLKNDGHDTNVEYASDWFYHNFNDLITNEEAMRDTLLVVTFDEGNWYSNHIYTVLIGPSVKPNSFTADKHNHYSILKMIEDELGIGNLGQKDATAKPITGIWKD